MSKYNFISSGMDEKEEVKVINLVMGAVCLLPDDEADKLHEEYATYRDNEHEQGNAFIPAWLYFKNRIQVTIKGESAQ